jgi:predicted transglutaminase-like cysteine proteinase
MSALLCKSKRQNALGVLAALVVILASLTARPCAAQVVPAAVSDGMPRPGVFGSIERHSAGQALPSKWQLARTRFESEMTRAHACDPDGVRTCHLREWLEFLDGLHGEDRWTQLVRVNQYINRYRYVSDQLNWGVSDYWATPEELFARNGDCEDYAIAKFFSLKLLGWSDDELRIVALQDLQREKGHAVLIAYHDGKTWLLDNQIGEVTAAATVTHYQPVYSVNESGWWRHQPVTIAARQ